MCLQDVFFFIGWVRMKAKADFFWNPVNVNGPVLSGMEEGKCSQLINEIKLNLL